MQPLKPLFSEASASASSFIGNRCTKHTNRCCTSAIGFLRHRRSRCFRASNVVAVMRSGNLNPTSCVVGSLSSLCQRVSTRRNAQHSSAGGVVSAVLLLGSTVEHDRASHLVRCFQPLNPCTHHRIRRIAFRRNYHTSARAQKPFRL